MVLTEGFLQAFFRMSGLDAGLRTGQGGGLCQGNLTGAVEHVVEELSSRLRAVPNYARRLRDPLARTFEHIDRVAESVPGTLRCSHSAFGEDPRINAFFVSPDHIREVFSQSEEVRSLFDGDLSTVTEFKGNDPHPGKDLTTGYFGFAGHNDPVPFRNIEIRKLTSE